MENKVHKEAKWLVRNKFVPSPADYDTQSYAAKESFNHGKVPFGSFAAQQDWDRTRKMNHIDDSYQTPGPGAYDNGQKADQKGYKGKLRSPRVSNSIAASGNFNQADLSRDNSGTRMMPGLGPQVKQTLVKKNMGTLENSPQLSASVLSLKQRG